VIDVKSFSAFSQQDEQYRSAKVDEGFVVGGNQQLPSVKNFVCSSPHVMARASPSIGT